MFGIAVSTSNDDARSISSVSLSGPLTSGADAAAVERVLDALPDDTGVLLDLDGVTELSDAGMGALRRVLTMIRDRCGDIVVIAEVVELRARLVIAELDRLAPLLLTRAQGRAVLGAAA